MSKIKHLLVAAIAVVVGGSANPVFAAEPPVANLKTSEFLNCPAVPRNGSAKHAQIKTPAGRIIFYSSDNAGTEKLLTSAQRQIKIADLSPISPGGRKTAGRTSSILQAVKIESAPKSPLISERNSKVDIASFVWKGKNLEVLVYRSAQGSRVLASIFRTSAREGGNGITSYHWYPAAVSNTDALVQDLTALEYLYPVAVNDVVTGAFRFDAALKDMGEVPGKGERVSHPQLLAKIAHARECIVESIGRQASIPLKRWRVVTVETGSIDAEATQVAARLREGSTALRGAMVFFRREPHMECTAISDRTGAANCELKDTHGDHHHHEAHEQPVVATYPGDIEKTPIRLPTTAVFRNGP